MSLTDSRFFHPTLQISLPHGKTRLDRPFLSDIPVPHLQIILNDLLEQIESTYAHIHTKHLFNSRNRPGSTTDRYAHLPKLFPCAYSPWISAGKNATSDFLLPHTYLWLRLLFAIPMQWTYKYCRSQWRPGPASGGTRRTPYGTGLETRRYRRLIQASRLDFSSNWCQKIDKSE